MPWIEIPEPISAEQRCFRDFIVFSCFWGVESTSAYQSCFKAMFSESALCSSKIVSADLRLIYSVRRKFSAFICNSEKHFLTLNSSDLALILSETSLIPSHVNSIIQMWKLSQNNNLMKQQNFVNCHWNRYLRIQKDSLSLFFQKWFQNSEHAWTIWNIHPIGVITATLFCYF